MRFKKPYSWLGIVIVLTLLLAIVPATAAFAIWDITFSKTTAMIGETITYTGQSFTVAPSQVIIYFSNQNTAVQGQQIGTHVTDYSTVGTVAASASGTISGSITIPSKFATNNQDVQAGTHSLYIAESGSPSTIVRVYQITVIGNAVLNAASPATGAPGTTVTLTGTNFLTSHAVTATFDGTPVNLLTGATTNAAGVLSATFNVPSMVAGAHSISVSDGTSTKTTPFTITPYVVAAPQSGAAGTDVTVAGNGFGSLKSVIIYFNNQQVATTLSSTTGEVPSTHITIPNLSLAAGNYDIKVVDSASNLGTAPFTLTVPVQPTPTATPTPTPTPTPTETATPTPTPTETADISVLNAGTNFVVSGSGFKASGQVNIVLDDDTIIGTVAANEAGAFVAQFQVASNLMHGDHIIAVTDGTQTQEYTYTVESTPPDMPVPSSPAPGATPKSPIAFTWSTVTDTSSPVSYELQIANDTTFSAAAMLVEKTGLSLPLYNLSADEQAKLAGQKGAYYWRLRAVDAASNGSSWAGPFELHVPAPFSFPTWLIYTMAGVGAVVIFGIGYLIGRRTAFYM